MGVSSIPLPGEVDRGRVESAGNAAGHGPSILHRPILSLKPKVGALAAPSVGASEHVPIDAAVSFVNWRRGYKRPTRRYATAEAAFAEARRLQAFEPDAVFYTYRLTLMWEGE